MYVHINNINGKMYVGITCKRPIERWGHNGIGYKRQARFWRAIKRYGWNNFEHVIFAEHLTLEEACNMERMLISEYKTNDKRYGYNVLTGGMITVEELEIINRMRTKISESTSGKNHRCYGRHLSETTKRKISESEKGRKKAPNSGTQPRPIVCVETGVVYPSIAEAARMVGVSHSNISGVLSGKRQRAAECHWKYF